MELINNTTKTLRDDLSVEMKKGSKLSIAAACFSIYAFQELKKQLSDIDELRFIFTSPTFITEKAKKEKREFYIPRLNRERSLYGTEFEIKLRNELTQKAIAKECAEWIKKKVSFKSNISDKTIQGGIVVDDVGYTPINNFTTIELGCEKGNVISTNGLSLGADDYISKPFGVMELRARINAHLRREHREHSVRMVLGRVCIQISQKKLLVDDKELPLTKAEYEICEFLAKNRGQVFAKEQILEEVFGFDSESNDSTIITHIKNIRSKFAEYNYTPIKTVWGIGYKWEE